MASKLLRNLPQIARLGCRVSANRFGVTSSNRSSISIQISHMVSSSTKNSATSTSPTTVSATEKTPYEIELEKLQKENKDEYYGFFEDEPVLDKILFHGIMFFGVSCFCAFTIAMAFYTPMIKGDDKKWKYREARWLMLEKRAKGVPLISADYAPQELIESMVPPAGEWEREWLNEQPTTKPMCTDWFGQNHKF